MRKIRGDRIGMIFQEPMTSLNPTHDASGAQIAEVLLASSRHWATAMRKPVVARHAEKSRHRQRRAAASSNIRMSSRADCANG